MTVEALAIIDNPKVGERLETVFQFLGHELALADDLDSLSEAVATHRNFLIALISLNDEDKLNAAVAHLNRKIPSLPVYVLREAPEIGGHVLYKGITGELEYPIQYRQLMGCMRQAELVRNGGSKGLSSTLTGSSVALREVQALVRHVSMTDANVLLLGESGTGKEVVARGIHNLSLRAREPFVAVNCGAIPADLLESELFGHEKGAFTGAISARRGRFELAEGGTLFLDEIGDMPMPMQVKLLRVIQERTFERVGGNRTMTSNVRLIAATHQNLEKQISEGKFRMDLFYRLNVFPIELPPLRDRPEDIPALIREFAARMEVEHSSPIEFQEDAIEALSKHPLPGNVRELENLVERLAILFPGETITPEKLPKRYQILNEQPPLPVTAAAFAEQRAPAPVDAFVQAAGAYDGASGHAEPTIANMPPAPAPVTEEPADALPLAARGSLDLKEYLSALEKTLIEQALEKSNWVVAKAAKTLSLQRTTLVEKIKKYDIQNTV